MSKEQDKKVTPEMVSGDFIVVVKTDGTTFVHHLSDRNAVWAEAKKVIGCQWLDHFVIQNVSGDVRIEGLVNDNGYADWNKAPDKVNQIATFIYNGGQNGHYVLGDMVVCLSVSGIEGWDFAPMNVLMANHIAKDIDARIKDIAMATVPKPQNVPDPEITISSFDSNEDILRYIKGDKSVKPSSVSIVSGAKKHEADTENNQ